MKILIYLILLFNIIACVSNNNVYWCGDHPCINKDEREAYFKKTMIVEVKPRNNEKLKNNSDIEKVIQQAKLEGKRRIKEEKDLGKQAKLEEKRRIKEEKDLAKQIEHDEKFIMKKKKITSKKIVNPDAEPQDAMISLTNFSRLAEQIISKNTFRSYPDINDIPE